MKYLMFLPLLLIVQTHAAEKTPAFNPADPTVWQEKAPPASVQAEEQRKALCAVSPSKQCPDANGQLTDTQREIERRDDKRRYNDIENHYNSYKNY